MRAILLLLLSVIGCQATEAITYPNNGAAMDNPVTLVASRATTWYSNIDGVLGRGERINVKLSPGRHDIQAGSGSIWLTVNEDFPLGIVRETAIERLPTGDFDIVALGGARADARSKDMSLQEQLSMRLPKVVKQVSPHLRVQNQELDKRVFNRRYRE